MLEVITSQLLMMAFQRTMVQLHTQGLRLTYGAIQPQSIKLPLRLTAVLISFNTQLSTYMESKMPNPTRIEINCETGVESIIELTDAEVAEMELEAGLAAQAEQDRLTAEALKAEAAASAVAKLEALGLTADEIAALRG
jgi:hypothetical protein